MFEAGSASWIHDPQAVPQGPVFKGCHVVLMLSSGHAEILTHFGTRSLIFTFFTASDKLVSPGMRVCVYVHICVHFMHS